MSPKVVGKSVGFKAKEVKTASLGQIEKSKVDPSPVPENRQVVSGGILGKTTEKKKGDKHRKVEVIESEKEESEAEDELSEA